MFSLTDSFFSQGDYQTLQSIAKSYNIDCPAYSTAWNGFISLITARIKSRDKSTTIAELESMASILNFLVGLDEQIKKQQEAIDARRTQLTAIIDEKLSLLE
jgi:hypothetical protein